MKYFLTLLFLIPSLTGFCQKNSVYPSAWKSESADTCFGKVIPDPYRWLEDINSPKTLSWVRSQKELTDQYRKKKKSLENGIFEKLQRYSYVDFKPLIKEGKYFFSFSIDDPESPPCLYFRKGINGISKKIIDPKDYSEKKKELLSIRSFNVSHDSKYLAFALSQSGADWSILRILNLETYQPTEDIIRDVKFSSLQWKDDGFFYIKGDYVEESERITQKNINPKLYYHRIGDNFKNDILIFEPQKEYSDKWFSCMVTLDQKYLIVHGDYKSRDSEIQKAILCTSLDSFPTVRFLPLAIVPKKSQTRYNVITNIGQSFLVLTDEDAPTGRVLLYDPNAGPNKSKEIIPRFKNVIEHVGYSNGNVICLYHLNGQFLARVYNIEGKVLRQITFPQGNSVSGFDIDPGEDETFYFVNSFYSPAAVHRLDLNTMKTELVSRTYIEFDQTRFETKLIKYKSFDNTEIPMYLTYRKGLKLKNENPLLLYGYGASGITLTPFFSPSTIVWIENGGIFAVPGIRGGGEKGSSWHEEGRRLNKVNSFKDFIAAARFLIDSSYTSREKIAIEGGSSGGLLVGAVITIEPDLFKAAVAEMGLFDMIRYDKFTIGANLINEFGTSSKKEDFENLMYYSPLHNIKKGVQYPSTLIITAENDDRVPPLHSYKFIATLQDLGAGKNPYLLDVIQGGGHYGPISPKQKLEVEAFKLGFLFRSLNFDPTTIY